MCLCSLSCVQLFAIPLTVACQAPLSMKFSRQEYWGGLPFPFPKDLLQSGIEPTSLVSPTLAGWFFATEPPESPSSLVEYTYKQLTIHFGGVYSEMLIDRGMTFKNIFEFTALSSWSAEFPPVLLMTISSVLLVVSHI